MSICFSSKRKKAEGIAAFLRALPADVLIKNSGSARESAGNNIKKGVHVAAAPAHWAAGSASTTKEKRESTSDNHVSARQRVEWPRADQMDI